MLGKTHIAAGACTGLLLAMDAPFPTAVVIMGESVLGALLPDIDHKSSTISQKVKPVGAVVSAVAGHRGLFHNVFAYAAVFLAVYLIRPDIALAVRPAFMGIATHLILDASTPMGVPLLFGKRLHLANIKTGSMGEMVLRLLFELADCILTGRYLLMALGIS